MADEAEGQGLDNTEASVEDTSYSPEETETAPQGNPFWKEVEDKLGPNNYAVIQPYLNQADTAHREGIEKLNSRYSPYKGFIDQGISPEYLQQSVGLARQLEENPEQIYESLGNFLRQNGRLPSEQELGKQVEEDASEEEDPRDAQIRQLREGQEQLQQFINQSVASQQQAQMAQEADAWLDGELKKIEAQGFDSEDMKEIVRIAASQSDRSGKEPDLAAAVQHYTDLQNRIRTAPRAGAGAPRVPGGVGGGTPGSTSQDPATMTKEQRIAAVAARFGGN